MSQKKKIMVMVPPLTGHMNPICGLIHELCKNENIEVLFYSDEQYREIIEKTGAKFRLNEKLTFSTIKPDEIVNRKGLGDMLDNLIRYGYDLLPQYIAEVEREKPDLILYDCLNFPAKYLIEVLKARKAKGITNIPLPKTAAFSPNFPFSDAILKTMREKKKEDIWAMLSLIDAFRKQFVFSWHYGISIYNPVRLFTTADDKLNIVGLNPELQPYRESYNETYKFVGSCVSEEARSVDLTDDPELKSLFAHLNQNPNDFKLIFMSLGTLFNMKFDIYEKAIEAMMNFDETRNRHFKLNQFKVIISVGTPGLKYFNDKISNRELDLPKNILLRAKVPQLEVLKRADLFITHCGMNSTLETIKYAVPVIGLPLDADQPTNAARICDELQFGVRLHPESFIPNQLADAIDKVLSDGNFKANIERMSKISAKYNGSVEGAKILTDYLYE